MAHVITEFPNGQLGRPNMYPWTDWEDGRIWVIQQGEDFEISLKNFRAAVHNRAWKHGKRVLTTINKDERTVTLQFVPREEA